MGRRVLGGIAIGIAAAAGAAAVAAAALSVVVARTVIIPPSRRHEDVTILGLDREAGTIRLSSNADSRLRGEYSFWFSGDTGHARLGEIIAQDDRTVLRRLLGVDFGDLSVARRGRLSGWFHLSPADLPFPYRDVNVETPLGAAPAWLIPAQGGTGTRWAINVHGRAVRRPETLRAIAPFHAAGYTSLIVSYRNDGDAPRSHDYRYALGDREWQDIEAAMQYAVDHGARELVLMGWSMGGAT
ncbi:MAG TPA: alpha/beta hydrolase, partial [Pseudolysinimonas sp.]|nr:alpha/beta hydrolase [Pseudolysinimonas sp.]